MTKFLFPALVIAGLIFASSVEARPPSTSCTAAGCFSDDNGDLRMDPSAATSTRHYLWCPGVASTTLPAAGRLEGAKSLTIHNKSAATCYVEFDGSEVGSTAATGDEYAAGDKQSQDISERTFGAYIRGVCTAVTASPSCLKLRWWK